MTALAHACLRDDLEIAKLLVKNGADINVIDSEGRSVFDHCPSKDFAHTIQEMCTLMWRKSVLMEALYDKNMRAFEDLILDDQYLDVNENIGDGWTILHAAVYLNRIEYVKILLQDARLNRRITSESLGQSAIDIAHSRGRKEILNLLHQF